MGQIIARWQHPVESKVALDMLQKAKHSALYRLNCMAIEMASEVGALYVLHNRS